MEFRSTKCPYCGHYLEVLRRTGWNDLEASLGPPTGLCSNCQQWHATGRKFWHQMNSFDKFIVGLRVAFGGVVGGAVTGGGIFILSMFLPFKMEPIETSLIVCFVLGVLVSFARHLYTLKKLIERHPPGTDDPP